MTPTVSLDFESFSAAGYRFADNRWRPLAGTKKGGLPAVGAAVYAEHPSAEVLIACYQFPGGEMKTWVPGMPNPEDLLDHVRQQGLVYAFNSMFEWLLWTHVCRRRYGWPDLPLENTRDTMALCRAYGLPGALAKASYAMGMAEQKDKAGGALIRRFCIPRSPTKHDVSLRNYMGDDHENAYRFYEYCAQDVRVESALAAAVPPLSDYELEVWKLDQKINARGVAVDIEAMRNCQAIVDGMTVRLTAELVHLTNGRINSASQVQEIRGMLAQYGIVLPDLRAETVEAVLADSEHVVRSHPWAYRVLEIRASLASASVKKLAALERTLCADGRVRGLFTYCGAERTGRWAGRGAQPQNFPRGDAEVTVCQSCATRQGPRTQCIACGGVTKAAKWNFDFAMAALEGFKTGGVDQALARWGEDVLGVIAGCLRSLFIAAPGHRFICSDYRAIEAVVLAALAGEEWRLEVFRTHGKIYEMSASKITGIPLEDYLEYKRVNGEHHPDRQAIGKVAELASGYQGWTGAWRNFGAGDHMGEETMKMNILRWRAESPKIVEMWANLQDAAINAIENPWAAYESNGVHYWSDGKVLRCTLPSGRSLVYHTPSVEDGADRWGRARRSIKFWGWNSNPKQGPLGWVQQDTYGGRLTENVVQAVSRDLMAHGMLNADRAGYNVTLHVHDEAACEQPDGHGSVAELEALMGNLPAWAADWPVIAQGGWEGREYRKD